MEAAVARVTSLLRHCLWRPRLAAVALLALLPALGAMIAAPPASHAARPFETGSIDSGDMELVVLEVANCLYCRLFRRDVLPKYEASPRARRVPIRFVDLNDAEADKLGLDGPVLIVPTVVFVKGRREIGRVPGYVGPENFFHAVNHLIGPSLLD